MSVEIETTASNSSSNQATVVASPPSSPPSLTPTRLSSFRKLWPSRPKVKMTPEQQGSASPSTPIPPTPPLQPACSAPATPAVSHSKSHIALCQQQQQLPSSSSSPSSTSTTPINSRISSVSSSSIVLPPSYAYSLNNGSPPLSPSQPPADAGFITSSPRLNASTPNLGGLNRSGEYGLPPVFGPKDGAAPVPRSISTNCAPSTPMRASAGSAHSVTPSPLLSPSSSSASITPATPAMSLAASVSKGKSKRSSIGDIHAAVVSSPLQQCTGSPPTTTLNLENAITATVADPMPVQQQMLSPRKSKNSLLDLFSPMFSLLLSGRNTPRKHNKKYQQQQQLEQQQMQQQQQAQPMVVGIETNAPNVVMEDAASIVMAMDDEESGTTATITPSTTAEDMAVVMAAASATAIAAAAANEMVPRRMSLAKQMQKLSNNIHDHETTDLPHARDQQRHLHTLHINDEEEDDEDDEGEDDEAGEDENEEVVAVAEQPVEEEEVEEEEEEEEGYVPLVDEAYDPYVFIRRLLPLIQQRERDILLDGGGGGSSNNMIISPAMNALPLKSPDTPRITLVLDLDETLVHCSTEPMNGADVQFPVTWNGVDYRVYAKKRPGLEQFMEEVSRLFEVVVFTASQKVYANKLLDILDPSFTWFKHRLFRETCVYVEGNYLKDLSVLGRDMATTVIIDNSPQAFGFQYNNGVPILSWYDDENDRELLSIIPFLRRLSLAADVRPLLRARYKLFKRIEIQETSEQQQQQPSSLVDQTRAYIAV